MRPWKYLSWNSVVTQIEHILQIIDVDQSEFLKSSLCFFSQISASQMDSKRAQKTLNKIFLQNAILLWHYIEI